jgi:hypothetical protein
VYDALVTAYDLARQLRCPEPGPGHAARIAAAGSSGTSPCDADTEQPLNLRATRGGGDRIGGIPFGTVQPHRSSSYSDESDPRRYRGEQQYAEPEGHAWFETHGDEAGHRPPGRRGGGQIPPGAPPGTVGSMGQWAGEPLPPVPTGVPQRDPMQHRDPTTTRETRRAIGRPAGSATVSDRIHRARRPAAGALIGIVAAVLSLPVLRILLDSASGPTLSASGVISSVLVLLGLPLFAIGLYGLATGAARAPDAPAPHAWLRPPVAYVTVALVLFVAAGLAAR